MWTKGLFVFIGPTFSEIPWKLIMRIKEIGHTDWKQNGRQNPNGNTILPPTPKISWSNVNNIQIKFIEFRNSQACMDFVSFVNEVLICSITACVRETFLLTI